MIKVSEIFTSIQGEGSTAGKPAVFLRLSGCNLKCSWCDSQYAWTGGDDLGYNQIGFRIMKQAGDHIRRLVITGGEPLLQANELQPLIQALPGWSIEIETNGTISPPFPYRNIQYNVSPKLSSSGVTRDLALNILALKDFRCYNSIYKFVVKDMIDLREVEDLVRTLPLYAENIYLMPEGLDEETLRQRMLWIVVEAIKRGYNVSPRLQVSIWGNRRGV